MRPNYFFILLPTPHFHLKVCPLYIFYQVVWSYFWRTIKTVRQLAVFWDREFGLGKTEYDNNYLQSKLPKAVCGKRWYTWHAACLRMWNLNFGGIKYINHALQLCTQFLQSHKHLASIFCIFDLKIKDILWISTCSLNSIWIIISTNRAINSVVWPISRCK